MGRLISLRSSIHKKILLLMLGLALPPMLLVGWMGLMSLERARALVVAAGSEALRAQAEQTLEQRAADKARLYDQSLHTIQQQVAGVARYTEHLLATPAPPTSGGQVWIAPDGPDERALAQHSAAVAHARHLMPLLDTTVQHNPLLTLGYIAFEDGGVLAFNDEAAIAQLQTIAPFDPRERPWYRGALERGEIFWTDLYIDANTQTPTITCAVPVRNPQGEIIGVVGFDMLLTTVKQDLQDVLIGDISANGYAQLLDHTGALLAHPELAPAATHWNEPVITENWQTSSNRELRAVAQQMLARESGTVQITHNAERVYIAFAPITATGWSIALVIPAGDIEQPAINTGLQLAQSQEQFQTRLLLLLVVSALLICGVGMLMAHSFTRPIRALRHSAHRVAGGHLDQRLPATGTDEIGELVQAFNTMTSALQQKVAELEANAHQLMLLSAVSNQLKTMLDLPHLLEMIPRIVCEQFGFARAVLYLVEDDILRVAAASFGPGNEAQARHFVEVANATLFSLDSAAGVVESMHTGQSDSAMRNSHPGVQIPIVGRDERVIGLLSAERSDPAGGLPPQMRGQLQMFANMAGLTIENVRLYDDLERQVAQRTAELRSALERVQLADRRKSDFLAAVSHELRTPLNAIIGFSAVLLDDPDHPLTPVQREDMQSIYSNGRFLLNLITDLLDLARIEAGHLKLDRSPVELAPLIDEVVDTVEGLRQDGDVQLLLDLPDDLPQVDADTDRVRQILLNLLSNAVKFTERGTITISAHQTQAAYLSITVADTGIGIPLERQHQLFDEFSQFHGRRSRTHGTGLGLAITRRLVEAHGGTIRVESVPGRGSSFTFTLPTCMQMLMVGMVTEHVSRYTPQKRDGDR